MRKTSYGKVSGIKSVFRLCLCLVVCCVLALAGTALIVKPVHAYDVVVPPLNAMECQTSTYQFTYTGAPVCSPTETITWVIQGNPAWLTMSPNGMLTAKPPKGSAGPWNFFVSLTESETGCWTPPGLIYPCTINVAPCAALSFTTNYLPPAQEGVKYYAQLGATGGQAPYTWTPIALPPGLTLSATGILSGTPPIGSGGNYPLIVNVTDSCCDTTTGIQGTGTMTIAYATYDILVSMDTSLKAGTSEVSVDDTPVGAMGGGDSQKVKGRIGTSHVVNCTTPVSDPQHEDIRFVADDPSQMVNEVKPSAYFVFHPEYRIQLNSDPPGVAPLSGSNWIAKDETFTASAPEMVEPQGQKDTRYEFNCWLLPNGTTSPNKDLSFTVTSPGSCTAEYNTLYALTLASKYGNETTWYPAGKDVNWTVASPKHRMSGIMGAFGGTDTASNPNGTAYMNGPQQIPITYESHVLLPIFLMFLLAAVVLGGGGFAIYRYAIQPGRAPTTLPPAGAARRLPEEIVEVKTVIVEKEKKLPAGKRAVKKLPPPAAKRLTTGRGVAGTGKTTKKSAGKKEAPPKAKSKAKSNFCPNCGDPIAPGEIYCDKCGKKLKGR